MKNFIFISPNFPENYWHFCRELKNNGLNVLGIGDAPYDYLCPELKDSLNEYYKVGSLENYDEVCRAVDFFRNKYGEIDWLESNNEYWLERDARLRTDFNIKTGFHNEDMPKVKYKSRMKEFYARVGIPTARYHIVDSWENCMAFIQEVGYPVIVKPNNGVGASFTYKLNNQDEVAYFFATKFSHIEYIMEEYIYAEINSYDAIINSHGEPIFEIGNVTPMSIMDVVNNADNSIFYILNNLADDTRAMGRATVKSFDVKSRFVHFEFFRLLKDHEGLGKKGELIGLEVNMRPSGGISPDMMNFSQSTDVYKFWADMIAYDSSLRGIGQTAFCAFAGRRDGKNFVMSNEDIMHKYGANMKMSGRVADALSGAMGNQMYIANFNTKEEMDAFYNDVLACR